MGLFRVHVMPQQVRYGSLHLLGLRVASCWTCAKATQWDGSLEFWQRDRVNIWEFNDEHWLVDALDQAGIDVEFRTIGELNQFWIGCKLPPLV